MNINFNVAFFLFFWVAWVVFVCRHVQHPATKGKNRAVYIPVRLSYSFNAPLRESQRPPRNFQVPESDATKKLVARACKLFWFPLPSLA